MSRPPLLSWWCAALVCVCVARTGLAADIDSPLESIRIGHNVLDAERPNFRIRVDLLIEARSGDCGTQFGHEKDLGDPLPSVVGMRVTVNGKAVLVPGACTVCGLYGVVRAGLSFDGNVATLRVETDGEGEPYDVFGFNRRRLLYRRTYMGDQLLQETHYFEYRDSN